MYPDYSAMLQQDLDTPDLEEVKKALLKGLKNSFAEVSVEVVNCPDLSVKPFNLACKGLGGATAVVEVGGPPYLLPTANREKVYNIKDLVGKVKMDPCLVIGAGAGPWFYLGKNAEMMANVFFNKGSVTNKTHVVNMKNDGTTNIDVTVLPGPETRFALLANLFFCEGAPSKVLKVHCKKRTGPYNFVTSMRTSLDKEFPNKILGVGGAFLLKVGKARQHVMPPDFSKTPIRTEEEFNEWLNFYDMSAPLVAVGTFFSRDVPELDLRVQHFHSFSDHGEGGHYHEDTTPDGVEYLGYFNLGQKIYRFDKPVNTHQVGRV